jgi:hypothetical protein
MNLAYREEDKQGFADCWKDSVESLLERFVSFYKQSKFEFVWASKDAVKYKAVYRGRIFHIFLYESNLVGEHPYMVKDGIFMGECWPCDLCLMSHLP